MYIWDTGHKKWFIFTLDGAYVNQVRQGADHRLRDAFYLGERGMASVYAADPYETENGGARFMRTSPNSREARLLRHLDHRQHQDPHLAGSGMFMVFPWDRAGMFLVSQDLTRLYAGYNAKLDFWVFDSGTGKKTGEIVDRLPVYPLTDEEIDANPGFLTIEGKRYDARSFPLPKTKPVIDEALIDGANRLWVRLSKPHDETGVTWRVYATSGQPSGQINLTKGTMLHFADDRFLYGTRYDEHREAFFIFCKPYTLEK